MPAHSTLQGILNAFVPPPTPERLERRRLSEVPDFESWSDSHSRLGEQFLERLCDRHGDSLIGDLLINLDSPREVEALRRKYREIRDEAFAAFWEDLSPEDK